ncbi:MAG TPA: hypothetical protein VHK28_01470 [Candidatus Limnocylindria bacterium]|nr:hypothetical protein [Candidatus Limnocylindria bacterium]
MEPLANPANAGVLRYLGQDGDPGELTVERPTPETDTWRLGAHPDVIEWLWTHLNEGLEEDSRFLIVGGAALAHPRSGVILALALGTQYALRLSGNDFEAARTAGYQTAHEFRTVGRSLDLAATFGPGWVFGRHDPREKEWLGESWRAANL